MSDELGEELRRYQEEHYTHGRKGVGFVRAGAPDEIVVDGKEISLDRSRIRSGSDMGMSKNKSDFCISDMRNFPSKRKRFTYNKDHTEKLQQEMEDAGSLSSGQDLTTAKSPGQEYDASSSSIQPRSTSRKLPAALASRLSCILSRLAPTSGSIADATLWIVTNSSTYAKQIAGVLLWSLSTECELLSTPVPAVIARLYLISEILLHHSISTFGTPGVSQYRLFFQGDQKGSNLVSIFNALGLRYKACGRMTASQMKARVDGVIQAWCNVELFPSSLLQRLRVAFYEPIDGSRDSGVSREKDPCEINLEK